MKTSTKMLLLVPVLALGIVEVAIKVEVPKTILKGDAPQVAPDRCIDCAAPA